MKRDRFYGLVAGLLLVVVPLLVACARATPTPTPAPTPALVATPAPATPRPTPLPAVATPKPPAKPEGTLVVAVVSLYEETFLPHTGLITGIEYKHPIYDHFFYLKRDTWEVLPGIVTKWELSADALAWTWTIRQGVKFHNGDDLTAEDVKFTLELLIRPDSQAARAGFWRENIAEMTVPDPYTLQFRTKQALWGFPEELAAGGPGFGTVVSKKYIDKVGFAEADKNPVGSGPYRLVERKRGEYVKYEAVENHWRVVPEYKYLILRGVPEEATRVAMLQTGEADLAAIGAASVEAVKKAGLQVKTVAAGYTTFAVMAGPWLPGHKYYKPDVTWADKRVRQALALSVNREEIAKNIYMGFARPVGTHLLVPGWERFKPYPYDPEKAKQLLAEAGFPKGFEATAAVWTASPGAELPLLAEALFSYWEKIGVKVKMVPTDFAAILPDIRNGATSGKIWVHRLLRQPDGESNLINLHSSGTGARFQQFQHQRIEEMLKELAALKDPSARRAKQYEILDFIFAEYGVIPLVVVDSLFGMSNKIGNWPAVEGGYTVHFEYITRPTPLGTFRLFIP